MPSYESGGFAAVSAPFWPALNSGVGSLPREGELQLRLRHLEATHIYPSVVPTDACAAAASRSASSDTPRCLASTAPSAGVAEPRCGHAGAIARAAPRGLDRGGRHAAQRVEDERALYLADRARTLEHRLDVGRDLDRNLRAARVTRLRGLDQDLGLTDVAPLQQANVPAARRRRCP